VPISNQSVCQFCHDLRTTSKSVFSVISYPQPGGSHATYDTTVRQETATWSQKYAVTWLTTYTHGHAVRLTKTLPALCVKGTSVPVHAMKAYRGRRGIAPLFLNLSFTPKKEPPHPLNRRLCRKRKMFSIIGIGAPDRPVRSSIVIPTELPCSCLYVALNIHKSQFPKRRNLYLKQRWYMIPPIKNIEDSGAGKRTMLV
jgi:hypothetical protein